MSPSQPQVVVFGDEVESVLTAVSAAQAGASVMLARRSTGPLGGLSVRGGLSYMDITPEYVTGLFKQFLTRAGVVRVALDPAKAHQVLAEMLDEANVTVISGVSAKVQAEANGWSVDLVPLPDSDAKAITLHVSVLIDSTPDVDLARALEIPYLEGLGGILNTHTRQHGPNFLGVSPVFRITGLPVKDLQAFEAGLRANPKLPDILSKALPYHDPALREEYITRPTFAPDDMDYLDILNPVIGIDYHIWRHGSAETYPSVGIAIDGANISRLPDGSLGFNGMVAQASALNLGFDELIALSQGGETPLALQTEMAHFERYLQEVGGFAEAKIITPQELYVRQTLNLLAKNNMTASQALQGGVYAEKAVGTFSYWLDLRGVNLGQYYPGAPLPKPVFNVGLGVALPANPTLENFAFVSRSAGYSPIGQGTGRIVQHNAMLGEALGIAAAFAAEQNLPLSQIAETRIGQIQQLLATRQGISTLPLSGHLTAEAEWIAEQPVLERDQQIVDALRQTQAFSYR